MHIERLRILKGSILEVQRCVAFITFSCVLCACLHVSAHVFHTCQLILSHSSAHVGLLLVTKFALVLPWVKLSVGVWGRVLGLMADLWIGDSARLLQGGIYCKEVYFERMRILQGCVRCKDAYIARRRM